MSPFHLAATLNEQVWLRDTILFAAVNYAHASCNRNGDHDYGTAPSAEEKRNLIKISQNALAEAHRLNQSVCPADS